MTEVKNVILEMTRNNVCPTGRTFGIIISGYCKEGRIQDALRFVYEMKDLGLKPNLVIFNTLINGCLDASDINEVVGLMANFNVKPDVIMFRTIMSAWSKAGCMIKCREVFENMVRAGIKPDVHEYSILAKGYVRAQEPEKAEELLATMEKARVGPSVVVYTIVISGWCSRGSMRSALKVFGQMVNQGIFPDLKTFETLIRGYARNKLPGKAKKVLRIMEKFGVRPEKSTFGLIPQASCGASLINEANRIMGSSGNSGMDQEMHEDGLERYYEKEGVNSSFPRLRIPSTVLRDQKGSAGQGKRGRMVLREAGGSCSTKVVNFKCRHLSGRWPVASRRSFEGQLCVSDQFAPCCMQLLC
ncbi:Pentatricopeptide repeat-containing protein [Striga hermonthica]|uniref:Pentatricopeptide repeat-containing protein n=1 Tax=Striga hermonthica TaxID=68872 RepID=A0A9N7RPA1_STRHE|nr:Pentatricopeptide repeat-containing protein [Striga hermonthica]